MRAQRYEETIKTPETCCPRREPVAQAAPSSVSPTVTPVESSSDSLNSRSASASPVEESQQYQEKVEQKKNRPSKQPLPGFHQAFGSTEIGRFSRSEFFASMMADDHSVSSDVSCTSKTNQSSNDSSKLPSMALDNDPDNLSNVSYYSEDTNASAPMPRWHIPCANTVAAENS